MLPRFIYSAAAQNISGQQRLDNVTQTHLVLFSGKPVLQKGNEFPEMKGFEHRSWELEATSPPTESQQHTNSDIYSKLKSTLHQGITHGPTCTKSRKWFWSMRAAGISKRLEQASLVKICRILVNIRIVSATT